MNKETQRKMLRDEAKINRDRDPERHSQKQGQSQKLCCLHNLARSGPCARYLVEGWIWSGKGPWEGEPPS